ncbi:MAG: hypothetical protein AAF389_07250 [Gemmatimonadota bacterium]
MFKITDELRERVRQRADNRCECQGSACRHHRRGARCKRGLRGDQWKIFWHSEKAGDDPNNLEAWCLDCFANNFTIPTHEVTLLRSDLASEWAFRPAEPRKVVTLRSVLRDTGSSLAVTQNGRVLDSIPDELWIEFATPEDALDAARTLQSRFHIQAARLNLPEVPLCSGIHTGQVRKSRTGEMFGEALAVAAMLEGVASAGQIVISDPVAGHFGTRVTLDRLGPQSTEELDEPVGCWVVRG